MNIKSITYILGWILNLEALFMLLPIATAVLCGESQGWAYAATMALCGVCGLLLTRKKGNRFTFYAKEGFVATALSWIVMSAFGALPFVFTGEIPSFVDALFETVSGFTTTGSSILTDVEALSSCSLIWRSFTHWIGGMGVLVFLLAVLPMVGGTNMQLMKAESPGPSVGKLVPKVRFTARILYLLYVAMTIVMIVLLLLGGMPVIDALCTAFGTAGTGGFGIKNDSMASYSPYIQWVVTFFMIAFGVNFNVYFLIYMRKFREALRCEEMRWYLAIIASASLLICANAYDAALTFEENMRHAWFQVGTIITTTGFATTDFDLWPAFSKGILVLLMFCGACAGSTGGGLKVSRIVIGSKAAGSNVGAFLHPRAVRKIRFEDKDVERDTLYAILVYFVAAFLVVTVSVLLVSLDNRDMVTNFTAVAATFNNIGPGLAGVGPTQNFSAFSNLSKLVMTFDMLAGRLEIFPILLLLYPPLWHETIAEAKKKRRIRARKNA